VQRLAEVCIRRPVFAAMIVLSLVVVGAASYARLGVDRFPSVDLPTVSVRTELSGASAEEVVEAAAIIEDAGFSTYDDLLHGFGGGYLPPVLGSRSRPNTPTPDFTFRTGMTVVIQPNVVTPNHRAGVQTGELVQVTDQGIASLHQASRKLRVVGED